MPDTIETYNVPILRAHFPTKAAMLASTDIGYTASATVEHQVAAGDLIGAGIQTFQVLASGAGTYDEIGTTSLVKLDLVGPIGDFAVACSDETTAISAGTGVRTFRMPYAMKITAVRASLNSACTTGTFTVDINEAGATILSTKLTIDATEKTSTTAATAAVISDVNLADDAEITIDVDDAGDGTATGLKVAFIGYRA